MKWLFTVIFLLSFFASWAQTINQSQADSLERKLSTVKNDRAKYKILDKLAGYYQRADPQKANTFNFLGLATAQRMKSDSDICKFYGYIGEYYVYSSNYKDGISYLNKEYELASKHNYKKYMSVVAIDIGLDYELQADYPKSLDYFFKALKLAEQAKNIILETVCYLNICVIYSNESNFDKTMLYANKVLYECRFLKNYTFNTKAYEFMGSAYVGKNNISEAQKYYSMALTIYESHHDNYGIATICSLIGPTYNGQYQKQLEFESRARAIFDKIAPKDLYAINNMGNLGITYAKIARQGNTDKAERNALFSKAEDNLTKAISIAYQTDSKQNIMDLTDSLAVIDAERGKYKDAYSNLTIHNKLSDSIYSQNNKNKIASLEGKHEIELRDKQLQINKLELANQQRQRWFLIGGLITLMLIAGLILNQSRLRKKNNTTLVRLNTELDEANKIKTRFFSILNHDLRSPIASFVNFLHLQQQAPDLMDETAQAAYSKKAASAAENLLSTMEDLLLWSKGQMENFKPHIKNITVCDLFEYIVKFSGDKTVEIRFEQPPGMYLQTDEHYIKTIMQNLTNNSVKALSGAHKALIIWRAWEDANTKYLSITDNGSGTTKDQMKALYDDSIAVGIKTGLGLHIVRDLAKAINCKITINNNEKGMEIQMELT